MGAAARVPAWKAILILLGLLLAVGVLAYPFMAWRVQQRELECGERCVKKGFSGYRYSPPEGFRARRPDKCECVNLK